jgi:hypothetical protein
MGDADLESPHLEDPPLGDLFAGREGVPISQYTDCRKPVLELQIGFPGIEVPGMDDPLATFQTFPKRFGNFGITAGDMGVGYHADSHRRPLRGDLFRNEAGLSSCRRSPLRSRLAEDWENRRTRGRRNRLWLKSHSAAFQLGRCRNSGRVSLRRPG